ncbi:MAG: UDP-glucuronic acid decarboxylase family protein [Pseudomonadota bacterium]
MTKVLLWGGAGFIGSNLSRRLLSDGHSVTVLDNLSTGDLTNLATLEAEGLNFVRQDICDQIFDFDPDVVLNLACPASPVHYQADPIGTTKTSVLGVINVLEFCERTGARLVHASTSEVYGDPQVHPQREDYVGHVNPIGIRACYDEGKRCAESLIFDYRRERGVHANVVRIFNTYGPKMQINDGRVVSNFVVQALRGDPITIYGDGLQTRSMCFVDDMVDAFVRLTESEALLPGPINLGNPAEITIKDFAGIVLEMTGSRSELVYQPLPDDDPKKRQPNIDAAKSTIGWEPKVALEEGLAATIEYFRERLALEAAA